MNKIQSSTNYEIILKFEEGFEEHINVDRIPPYSVGQTFSFHRSFPDQTEIKGEYKIIEIKHGYRSLSLHPENKESNTVLIQLILKKVS